MEKIDPIVLLAVIIFLGIVIYAVMNRIAHYQHGRKQRQVLIDRRDKELEQKSPVIRKQVTDVKKSRDVWSNKTEPGSQWDDSEEKRLRKEDEERRWQEELERERRLREEEERRWREREEDERRQRDNSDWRW